MVELLSARRPPHGISGFFRVMYGVAMGGRGVASSLRRWKTIPDRSRGLMSAFFRRGLSLRLSVRLGYFLALSQYGAGWRGMFLIGALPVVLLPAHLV